MNLNSLFDRQIERIIRHPIRILVTMALLIAATLTWLLTTSPLSLDTNFASLLPDDLPCVVESKRIAKHVGSTDHLYIAIESASFADNIAVAKQIAAALDALPEIEWVTIEEDKSFFRKHRLLYLDTPDLQQIVDRATERVQYEKKIANPFFINIADETPPDISFDDIMARYETRLGARGGGGSNVFSAKKDGSGGDDAPDAAKVDIADYLASPDGTIVTVMARPSRPATDMDFGMALVEKAQQIIDATQEHRNPTMKIEVAGSYRNRYLEYRNVVRDIISSLGLSFSLIVLVVALSFRAFRPLLLIFIPLLTETLLTLGATALTFGRLNMVTALIFAVLLGLGIDFGVHMTSRYLFERKRGASLTRALQLSLQNTGKAVIAAAATTATSLAVLWMADFKGFSEFGAIALMGILLCLVVFLLMVPALATLLERIRPVRPLATAATAPSADISTTSETKDTASVDAPLQRRRPLYLALAAFAIMTIVSLYYASHIGFEYNFYNLGSSKKISTDIKYGKTLSQSSSPVVALLDTPDKARLFTRHLEGMLDADTASRSLLKNAFSIFSFVPDDQETKVALLELLREQLDQALRLEKLNAKTRKQLEDIREWTTVQPFALADLPDWVQGKFSEKDGTIGRMVYLFPRLNEYYVDQMSEFYDEFGSLDIAGIGHVHPSASGFILVEVVRAVQRDGVMMAIFSLMLVLVVLFTGFRKLSSVALIFIPLLSGLIWTAGIMGFFGIKLGLYNMLVLPLLLGTGIDASIHIFHSYSERGPGSIKRVLKQTGFAVLVSSATTAVGFVGMAVASHLGLRSIGTLATIGISVCLVSALTILPVLLLLKERRNAALHRGEKTSPALTPRAG
ncbi:MAG: MMPL family transporter [Proteobacteria bacterium]|nr:MMPL family transporter [Pseudomonadota bacterium]